MLKALNNSHAVAALLKLALCQCLGHDVSNHHGSGAVLELNFLPCDALPRKVVDDVDVL